MGGSEDFNSFLSWARSEGIELNQKLQVRDFPETGWGLVATDLIGKVCASFVATI